MKKKMFQNSSHLLKIIVVFLFISVYSNVKAEIGNRGSATEKKIGKEDTNPDLEIIRKRIISDLLAPSIDEDKIKRLVKSIRPDGSWPGINYIDTSRTGFQHSMHLENMLDLARAFKKTGSVFYMNPEVKKVVSSALDFWINHDFICANWWWNEMGTPNWMINTLLVLDTDLTEKQQIGGYRIANRANLEGFGARPGGDLIQIAGMLGKQGLFKRDEAILERVVKVMTSEIKVSIGRGLQPDMSFHHRTDNVISTHTYGTGYAGSFAYWAVKIAGTKFTFPKEAMKLLVDYYLDGISKSMAFGIYPDLGAKNRDLSRKGTLAPAGTDIIENLLRATDYRKTSLEDLLKVRKSAKQSSLTWNRFFWHSGYYAHQRQHWFSSVRMHSSRQNNMEEAYNEEGLKNHHFADGSNFITRSGKEYLDIFPVWDWQKIPGATIVQKPALPHWKEIAKKGLTDFAGAVTDGEFGAAAFDFKSPHDQLRVRKSWFFFDREYVCLGAGISSEEEYPVTTTLNQCLQKKEVKVMSKKGLLTLKKGQHSLTDVAWVVHDSVAYLFASPASVNISDTIASGNWRQINHQSSATDDLVQKDVFTLWLDHGRHPISGSYAYTVVPGIAALSVDQYRKEAGVSILANTEELQAVQHKGLNISQVVFYKAGTIKINENVNLTASSPCIVMIKISGKELTRIAVSDPTHKEKSLQLTVSMPVIASGKNWQATWNKESKLSVIKVDLPAEGDAGKSTVLELGNKK